jgi:hypothetical protein
MRFPNHSLSPLHDAFHLWFIELGADLLTFRPSMMNAGGPRTSTMIGMVPSCYPRIVCAYDDGQHNA